MMMHGLKSIRVETLGLEVGRFNSTQRDERRRGGRTDKKLVSNKTNNVEFRKRGRTTEGAAVVLSTYIAHIVSWLV